MTAEEKYIELVNEVNSNLTQAKKVLNQLKKKPNKVNVHWGYVGSINDINNDLQLVLEQLKNLNI